MNIQEMLIQLMPWAIGIFFTVTIFIVEGFAEKPLNASIRDHFYLCDWKRIMKFFTIGLFLYHLLIYFMTPLIFNGFVSFFSSYVKTLDKASWQSIFQLLLYLIFHFLFSLLLSIVLYRMYIHPIWKRLRSETEHCRMEFIVLRNPIFRSYILLYLSLIGFFLSMEAIYFLKFGVEERSMAKEVVFLMQQGLPDALSLMLLLITLTICYLLWIAYTIDLFKNILKMAHKYNAPRRQWIIYYHSCVPSQEGFITNIAQVETREIIKDEEGYYYIPEYPNPGEMLRIPLSSVIEIKEQDSSAPAFQNP